MAEDETSTSIPSGLDASDLAPNVYEGGFKTWECSLDLCRFLLDRGPRKDLDDMARVAHVLEMGCGSALPSVLLFQYALRERLGMEFTLTDYNADVLRLVTVPNLVLAWVGTLSAEDEEQLFEGGVNPLRNGEENGEVYITPELLAAFTSALSSIGISVTLISGSWTPTAEFLALVPSTQELETLVLGSETIYSPASLVAFTAAMAGLMKRVRTGKTIVAAKRVYFGVGGSVDGFRAECAEKGCVAWEVDFEGLGGEGEGGVRRCLLEVQML
jgi:protein-histidine N-methyltransferase